MFLAWGAKVSAEFRARVVEIAAEIGCDPSHLMACMAFETGGTFSPSVRNPQSSATGLIQFMASTARALGTTTEALAQMSALEQLEYVARYFRPFAGRLRTLSDVYMAILWPAAVGKPDDSAIFVEGTPAYYANRGLDVNGSGSVTKGEAAAHVAKRLVDGMLPNNAADVDALTQTPAPITGGYLENLPPVQSRGEPMAPLLALLPSIIPVITPLLQSLFSIFKPAIEVKGVELLGKVTNGNDAMSKQILDQLLALLQQTTGIVLPTGTAATAGDVQMKLAEMISAVKKDVALQTKVEESFESYFKVAQPMMDFIAAREDREWSASEESADRAAARTSRMQDSGPIYNNPTFIISAFVMALVTMVVSAVLFTTGDAAFSNDMKAFVIGAIVGTSLSAVLAYFLGTSRQSAAKDSTIADLASRRPSVVAK